MTLKNLLIILFLLVVSAANAQNKQEKDIVGYFGFAPDIVTNTLGENADNLGAVRMRVELMIDNEAYLPIIEYHEPLLKALLIKTVSRYEESVIDTASGKEQLRRDCLKTLQTAMKEETGKPLVRDVIFGFIIADPI